MGVQVPAAPVGLEQKKISTSPSTVEVNAANTVPGHGPPAGPVPIEMPLEPAIPGGIIGGVGGVGAMATTGPKGAANPGEDVMKAIVPSVQAT